MKLFLPANSRRRRGFTLIELLMAMVILTLLVVMLFAVFSQASRGWLQSENRVETFSQARAALDFMARELTQTMTTSNISFLGSANNVGFVAPINTGTSADLEGVFYQLTGSSLPFTLTRGVTNLATCYAAPRTWTNSVGNTGTLAENVVSLLLSYTDSSGGTPAYWNSTSAGTVLMTNRAPAGVQITIGILDSRAASRLATNPAAIQTITNQATQYFSTYVAIPNSQ